MSFNFYQEKDEIIQNLIDSKPNNSILFSTDKIKLYGKFSDKSSLFGEQYKIIFKDEYPYLFDRKKLDDKRTYCIIDGDAKIGVDYNYPIGIGIKENSLVFVTNEAITDD